jgi:hypothetical protein
VLVAGRMMLLCLDHGQDVAMWWAGAGWDVDVVAV